ncbi:MAG: ATP-binding cassette domain-containing protein [Sulfuricurvum sp.]|uniref:ATP-binding cassette domain-containing protein n=1 Tax=Sulfuricurvum sp. TaxID=2025608 RepID=UPI0026092C67|nr:ATP-binding cassette domain-containing protein [Sulfuricurvum sp.]MDD2830062.1 ATP-binding cassette domain-containing protein [Sulfuricurvum sp.]MDD4950630.1 ATP-binding cassette domain-containing protein [Sulfuricurvum sp.]
MILPHTIRWFLDECAHIRGIGQNEHHVYEEATNVKQPFTDSIEHLYNLIDLSGFERRPTYSFPDEKQLPMVALDSENSVIIIYAKKDSGEWLIRSFKGENSVDAFAPNTQFISLVEKQKIHNFTKASQMFSSVAWREKNIFMNGALASVLINVIALSTSFYSMQIYDRVIPTQGMATLIALSVGVFIAMIFELVMKVVRTKIVDRAIESMDITYSHEIFRRLLNIRSDRFPRSIGTLSSKVQSYGAVRGFITSASLYLLVDLPFALLFVVVVIMIGTPILGVIAIAFFILSIIVGVAFRTKIDKLSRESNNISHKKLGLLVETIEGSETIKTAGASWQLLNRWNQMSRLGIEDDVAIRFYSELSMYLSAFMQQSSYISIVAVGAYIVSVDQSMTMGGLIACTILSGRMLSPVNMIPNMLVQWGKAKMAIEDIENIYVLESENEGINKPLNPAIITNNFEVHNVTFAFEDRRIITIPHLTIRSGEKIAILGTIGSGKSTLLRLLSGLYKPTEGKVMIGGLDIAHISRDRLSQETGYLPQDTKLFAGTLRDNLTLGLSAIADEIILEACNNTGLIHYINAHPKGLDAPIAEGGNVVSGGQRQLIALTRVLINNPNIYLLDEPTANLDEGSERYLIGMLMQKMKQNTTMIVVTHKPQILSIVSRIIIIGNEGIIMDGPKEEVLRKIAVPYQQNRGNA